MYVLSTESVYVIPPNTAIPLYVMLAAVHGTHTTAPIVSANYELLCVRHSGGRCIILLSQDHIAAPLLSSLCYLTAPPFHLLRLLRCAPKCRAPMRATLSREAGLAAKQFRRRRAWRPGTPSCHLACPVRPDRVAVAYLPTPFVQTLHVAPPPRFRGSGASVVQRRAAIASKWKKER